MVIDIKVKNMTIEQLRDLKYKINVQYLTDEISRSDYMRADIQIMELIRSKSNRKTQTNTQTIP